MSALVLPVNAQIYDTDTSDSQWNQSDYFDWTNWSYFGVPDEEIIEPRVAAPLAQDKESKQQDLDEPSVCERVTMVPQKRKLSSVEWGTSPVAGQPPNKLSVLGIWQARTKAREERKQVLKISINKLRQIDDPEVFLRRSVLIHNTMQKLQKEVRDEKTSSSLTNIPCDLDSCCAGYTCYSTNCDSDGQDSLSDVDDEDDSKENRTENIPGEEMRRNRPSDTSLFSSIPADISENDDPDDCSDDFGEIDNDFSNIMYSLQNPIPPCDVDSAPTLVVFFGTVYYM